MSDVAGERTLGTRIFAGVIMLVALGVFGLVVWRAATTESDSPQVAEIPLIKADERPVRVRPDDRGGMAIPHEGRFIYQTFDGDEEEPVVERLLPPPEEPINRERPWLDEDQEVVEIPETPDPIDSPGESIPSAQIEAPQTPENTVPDVPVGTPPPPPIVAEEPEAEPAPVVAALAPQEEESVAASDSAGPSDPPALEIAAPRPVPPVDPIVTPPANRPATPIAVPSSAYRVQLAAFRGRGEAEQAWRDIQAQAPGLLDTLSPEIMRADLGSDRGVFYRLRAGPLPDRASAVDLCASLQARNQDCIIVTP